MVFSSPLFLFLFLPLVLALGSVGGLKWRNRLLLLASVVFYAWGEVVFVFLMLGSALVNHGLGRWVDREEDPARRQWVVGLAVVFNIGSLAFFKYANFVLANLNDLLALVHSGPLSMDPVRLPLGISFFTFHALSYVIDVYRRKWPAATGPEDVALYIFFFPQLIAGPILRWSAIAPQLAQRVVTRAGFAEGIRRFAGGLAKKMLIANVVAVPADQLFALPGQELTAALAWFAIVCYTLQIYFDFSGYSDMAIGLGKMFGFTFIENFNFPYIAQSIRDFWRRWHISLSTWFRDYLYIPLGGNHGATWRTHLNLLMVFFLCGLWHGASWTFVIWGLYHGVFLILERTRFGVWLAHWPRPLRHGYTLLVVMVGLVIFRADTFSHAGSILASMAGFATAVDPNQKLARYWNSELMWSLSLGIVFSMPAWNWLKMALGRAQARVPAVLQPLTANLGLALEAFLVIGLLLASSAWLAGGTYNPFIYFRF